MVQAIVGMKFLSFSCNCEATLVFVVVKVHLGCTFILICP